MTQWNRLSLSELSLRMQAGEVSAVELAKHCIAQIKAREPAVNAWVYWDEASILAQAQQCDATERLSPLHGIPVGIKDIIDVAGLPAQYGSPIYEGHVAHADAACVSALRKAGAVIMGKTVTTEFAMRHPNKTHNPLNLAHTPGGSSSGSAAGVADFMMPLALGTQTGGSVLRPASFCGLVGFKPSFGLINRAGVKPNSESLDTVGLIARSVQDVALSFSWVSETQPMAFFTKKPLSVGYCHTPQWPSAEPATIAAMEKAAKKLTLAGSTVTAFDLPKNFNDLLNAHAVINDYEAFRALSPEIRAHRDQISASLQPRISTWASRSLDEYIQAQKKMADARLQLRDVFAQYDFLLVPSACGEAPITLHSTGEATFNAVWTALHGPAITVPAHIGPLGLPVGVQLVGAFGDDHILLSHAAWVESVLQND